jgi:hypothetical protein
MDSPRYLPASHVKAGSLRLGQMSVRSSNDREIGKLAGFVIDEHRIRSMVVDCDEEKLEVPMTAVQFDAGARLLRIVQNEGIPHQTFSPSSVPHVEVEDLWIPFFHSAA